MNTDILQELADKSALDELVYRQALAVDRHDWPTYRACFEDDIDFDLSDHTDRVVGRGFGILRSGDVWVSQVMQLVRGFDSHQHLISNACHTVKGDHAETVCHVLAEHFLNNDCGDRSISVGGIYTMGCVRRQSGWKIKTWRMKVLWYRGNPTLYRLAAEKSQSTVRDS